MNDKTLFFDSWSDGPFTYEEVAEMVAENPEVADKFHTHKNVSFANYRNSKMSRPIDISIHPLVKQVYDLCRAIEELPASEAQTELSTESNDLLVSVFSYILDK